MATDSRRLHLAGERLNWGRDGAPPEHSLSRTNRNKNKRLNIADYH